MISWKLLVSGQNWFFDFFRMACERWRYTWTSPTSSTLQKRDNFPTLERTTQIWKYFPCGTTHEGWTATKLVTYAQPAAWLTNWNVIIWLWADVKLLAGDQYKPFSKSQGTISSLELGWTCCVKHGPKQAPHEKWLSVFSCFKMDLKILILELKFNSKKS
jgi:hypothetical protein